MASFLKSNWSAANMLKINFSKTKEIVRLSVRLLCRVCCLILWLPDLPYFTGDPVFQPHFSASREEAAGETRSPAF